MSKFPDAGKKGLKFYDIPRFHDLQEPCTEHGWIQERGLGIRHTEQGQIQGRGPFGQGDRFGIQRSDSVIHGKVPGVRHTEQGWMNRRGPGDSIHVQSVTDPGTGVPLVRETGIQRKDWSMEGFQGVWHTEQGKNQRSSPGVRHKE